MELLEAFKSPKISDLQGSRIGTKIGDALTKAYYHLGYKIPDTEDFIKLQIYLNDFLNSEKIYQAVSIDEVSIAIKKGSDRQYGEFFGIAPATVTGWIRAFLASDNRKDAKVIQLSIEEQSKAPKPEPTPEQQWENFVSRLRVLYSNFLTGIIIQPAEATFVFKVLRRSRIINFDESRRNSLKAKALVQIKKEADPKRAINKVEKRRMTAAFEVLLQNETEDPQVINRAMALGLIEWFDDLKQFGTSIDEAVNEEF
ncbi:hypothetical protein [Pedobacter westerhofensis]|nr:hypothetical protein [Pedobacter westerhofensis]